MQAKSQDMERGSVLTSTTVQQLIVGKGRLVEVPYTASVGDTLHAMLAHNILSVPVAAPPGQWIGAGGSMILQSDKSTGAARKHYIGMVSVLDVLMHLAEVQHQDDFDNLLTIPVSTIIGHCIEGLSLWTISPHTSVYEALEPMSKGIHRALIPIDSQMEHTSGIELQEASPGYRMLTQTDLIRFLRFDLTTIQFLTSRSVESLGAVQSNVFGVSADMTVADTITCMSQASLSAVAIVEPLQEKDTTPMLVLARGRKLVGTFSASDLRGCSSEGLRLWSRSSVLEFVRKAHAARKYGIGGALVGSEALANADLAGESIKVDLVTCLPSSSLEEVMSKAVDHRVHRVWVTDEDKQGCLWGVVAMSDMLRVIRQVMKEGESSYHLQ